jgi:uncharacterized membrane protein
MNKLKRLWSNLRSSFWFVPSLILAFSIALAMALVQVHFTANSQWLVRWPRLFGASAEGSREMLSTIAGSMMTVVGVTFSMTLVTLALASSQYTSRILRNFMGDRVTQVVLGVFSGIFAYCLIILRTIRSGDEDGELKIIAIGPTFASLVAESFDQIRGSANGNVAIMIRMLGSIQTIASLTANLGRRQVLREQAQWIAELAERTIESPHDKTRFENRLADVLKALD